MGPRISIVLLPALTAWGAIACTNDRGEERQPQDLPPSTDVESSDGGDSEGVGPSTDGASADDDIDVQEGCIRNYVENAGHVFMTISDEIPQQPDERYATRMLSVEEHEVFDGYVGRTKIGLTGTTDIQTTLSVGLFVDVGMSVATKPGDSIQADFLQYDSSCKFRDTEHLIERVPVFVNVIRSDAGELLLLSAGTIPMARDGTIVIDASIAPEVEFRWFDGGCPDFPDSSLDAHEREDGFRSVAIAARDARDPGMAFSALPREGGTEITLASKTYILVVSYAEMPRHTEMCGTAAFSLYKKGYLVASP